MVGYFSLIAWCISGMYDHFSTECIPSNQEKRGLHKDLDQFCLMGKKMSNFTKFLASKLHTNEMRWHWVQTLWIKSCKKSKSLRVFFCGLIVHYKPDDLTQIIRKTKKENQDSNFVFITYLKKWFSEDNLKSIIWYINKNVVSFLLQLFPPTWPKVL